MTCVADNAVEARADQALVARVLMADDRRAFEQLLRRHQGMVRAQLRRLVQGDAARADDLAQETFLLAWRKLHQFRGEARFSTWLYRIAYSCFLQAHRKQPLVLDEAGADAAHQMPPPSRAIDLRLDIERAMRLLSRDEQIVLTHCVLLELSHDEAAYALSMPLGTVKSHVTRGKTKLRALLADWHHVSKEDDPS